MGLLLNPWVTHITFGDFNLDRVASCSQLIHDPLHEHHEFADQLMKGLWLFRCGSFSSPIWRSDLWLYWWQSGKSWAWFYTDGRHCDPLDDWEFFFSQEIDIFVSSLSSTWLAVITFSTYFIIYYLDNLLEILSSFVLNSYLRWSHLK